MIDGVKLMTHIYDVNAFRLHIGNVFKWIGKHDEETGEVLDNSKAEYKGLDLSLMKSKDYDYFILSINGSLQVFGLGGTGAKSNFTMLGIQKTVIELSAFLGIEAKNIIIQNLEVSCTIQLNVLVEVFMKQFITQFRPTKEKTETKNKEFDGIEYKRDSYVFKVYDKGLNIDKVKSNIIRIEVGIKESKLIREKYEIHNLSDLTKPEKVNRLFDFLEKQLLDCIIIDDKALDIIQDKSQKIKVAQWINPKYWRNLDKEKRRQEKDKLKKWLLDTGFEQLKYDVLYTMRKAWQKGITEQTDKYHFFGDNTGVTVIPNSHFFDCIICRSNWWELPNKESKEKVTKGGLNFDKNSRGFERTFDVYCLECQTQKTGIRKNKKYCCEKCRVKANGKRLNETRKAKRATERMKLENLKIDFENMKVRHIVKYEMTGERTKVQLAQLAQMKLSEIVKINKVEILMTKNKTMILTKQRAKDFIKWQRVAQLANLPQAATHRR